MSLDKIVMPFSNLSPRKRPVASSDRIVILGSPPTPGYFRMPGLLIPLSCLKPVVLEKSQKVIEKDIPLFTCAYDVDDDFSFGYTKNSCFTQNVFDSVPMIFPQIALSVSTGREYVNIKHTASICNFVDDSSYSDDDVDCPPLLSLAGVDSCFDYENSLCLNYTGEMFDDFMDFMHVECKPFDDALELNIEEPVQQDIACVIQKYFQSVFFESDNESFVDVDHKNYDAHFSHRVLGEIFGREEQSVFLVGGSSGLKKKYDDVVFGRRKKELKKKRKWRVKVASTSVNDEIVKIEHLRDNEQFILVYDGLCGYNRKSYLDAPLFITKFDSVCKTDYLDFIDDRTIVFGIDDDAYEWSYSSIVHGFTNPFVRNQFYERSLFYETYRVDSIMFDGFIFNSDFVDSEFSVWSSDGKSDEGALNRSFLLDKRDEYFSLNTLICRASPVKVIGGAKGTEVYSSDFKDNDELFVSYRGCNPNKIYSLNCGYTLISPDSFRAPLSISFHIKYCVTYT